MYVLPRQSEDHAGRHDAVKPDLLMCSDHVVVMGADFKNGVAAAVPGWENVRLLAPHAELRLLVCGESTIIDAHRLRCQMPPRLSCTSSCHAFALLGGLMLPRHVCLPRQQMLQIIQAVYTSCMVVAPVHWLTGSAVVQSDQPRSMEGAWKIHVHRANNCTERFMLL